MSCVSPCVSSDAVKRSDVERWSTHVTKVLNSPPAHRKFCEYLQDEYKDEDYNTLQFWVKIDNILKEKKKNDQIPRNELKKSYRELVTQAEEEVNFDEREIRELRSLVKTISSPVQEDAILRKAKRSAEHLLAEAHKTFSEDLWEKVG